MMGLGPISYWWLSVPIGMLLFFLVAWCWIDRKHRPKCQICKGLLHDTAPGLVGCSMGHVWEKYGQ